MSSWKQYGGRTYAATNNNITASSIFCDKLTIQTAYEGSLDISGSLNVNNDLRVYGNIYTPNYIVSNNLEVSGNAFIAGDLEVSGNLIVDSRLQFGNPEQAVLDISTELLDLQMNNSLLQIVGDSTTTLSVGSTSLENENILAKNRLGRGIESYVDSLTNGIRFFGDLSETVMDASILYHSGGTLEIDISGFTYINGDLVVGDLSANQFGSALTVYDNSAGLFRPSVYSRDLPLGKGLTVASSVRGAVTGVDIIDPSGNLGGYLYAGAFPGDTSRSFLSLSAGSLSPSLGIVTGSIGSVTNTSTVGINTYSPVTEDYVLDVNGPVYLHHGEVAQTFSSSSSIYGSVFTSNIISLVGDPLPVVVSGQETYLHPVSSSTDGGVTWDVANCDLSTYIDTPIDISFTAIAAAVVSVNSSILFVGAESGYCYYSNNNGFNWYKISTIFNNACISAYAILIVNTVRLYLSLKPRTGAGFVTYNLVYFDIPLALLQAGGNISNFDYDDYPVNNTNFSVINHIIGDSGNNIYLLGNNVAGSGGVLAVYDINVTGSPMKLDTTSFAGYVDWGITLGRGIYDNNSVVFVQNRFYYNTFANIGVTDFIRSDQFDSNLLILDVYVYDSLFSIVVGENITSSENQYGFIYFSVNGFSTFTAVPDSILNNMGNSFQLLNYPINRVYMSDLDHFVFLTSSGGYYNRVFNSYLPDIFNSASNLVMDVVGLVQVTGVVSSNAIISDSATFTTFNSSNATFTNLQSTNATLTTLHITDTGFLSNLTTFHAGSADISNLMVTVGCAIDAAVAMTSVSGMTITGPLTSGSLTNNGSLYQNGDSYFGGSVHLSSPLDVTTFVVPSLTTNIGYTSSGILNGFVTQSAYNTNIFSNDGSGYVSLVGSFSLPVGVWSLHLLSSLVFVTGGGGMNIDSIAACISTVAYTLQGSLVSPLFIQRIPGYVSSVGDTVQNPFSYTLVVSTGATYYLNLSVYAASGVYPSSAYTLGGHVQYTRIA